MRAPTVTLVLALGLAVGCGGSEPIGVQLAVQTSACGEADCRWTASGSGILAETADSGADDLSTHVGAPTLYAEATRADDTLVVVEISFVGALAQRARYREVQDGRVSYRGQVAELQGHLPSFDDAGPVAGRFSFLVRAPDGAWRRVAGLIIPATGEAVRVTPERSESVATPTSVSCQGEVYVPPPELPDDLPAPDPDEPWTPTDPGTDPDPMPDPSTPEPGSTDGTTSSPPPPAMPSGYTPPEDSGCDDTSSPEPSGAADSGCEGDDSGGMSAPADGGCEGDDSGGMSAPADSGCEGDGSGGSSSSSDTGCDGDSPGSSNDSCEGAEPMAAAAVTVVPGSSRVFASLARLFWPIGLAGLFNRGARRRRNRG
jgi:hypothetical protein